MSIFSFMRDIFVESSHGEDIGSVVFRDRTTHYHDELMDCFLDAVWVGTGYEGIAPMLEGYKYRSERERSSYFAEIFEKFLCSGKLDPSMYSITTVPMHWSRYCFRGFDHMRLILKELNTAMPKLRTDILLTSRFSLSQSKQSYIRRKTNREDVFHVSMNGVVPKRVILLDDVISS